MDAVCVAPWVSLEFDPSGWVYACCANQLYPLGRIGHDRLTDLWNGDRAKVLKDALAHWDLSVGCASCRWHLEHGRDQPEMAVYDRHQLTVEEPAGPVSMTFSLSNRCNLACVMCTPELSSTLRHSAGLPPMERRYDERFFRDLEHFIPGLKFANFMGGEPFLVPEHHRVWDLLESCNSNARLHVTTNGTIWNDRVEALLDRFVVDICVSVDGATPATYESVRPGAEFALVERNVDRFARACAASGAELRLNFCLMPATAPELHQMLRWGDRLGVRVNVIVVTDDGHDFHQLDTEELRSVARDWASAAAEHGELSLNSDAWETQVLQLDRVLGDRRDGRRSPSGQAAPPGVGFLSSLIRSDSASEAVSAATLEAERSRLTAWSGGGPVGECRLDRAGTIVDVPALLPRLGISGVLEGEPLDVLLAVVEAADGRSAWALEADTPRPGIGVRSVALSAQRPVRGSAGSIVRFVHLAGPEGSTVLVAEDRIYDRRHSIPVRVTS